jgi:6-phosphogluconolactonase
MPPPARVRTFPHASGASRAGAEGMLEAALAAVAERGRFSVALSGGDTPREMYQQLAREPLRSAFPWAQTHFFWGDERCVPPEHPRSNYGMAFESFLAHVPAPPGNLHRMRGEDPPEQAAAAYALELRGFFGEGLPRFDLIHLGVGEDGHTASLFPASERLTEQERTVCTAYDAQQKEFRLTLTAPVLNAASRVEFLVLEPEKADIVRTILHGPQEPSRWPAQLIRPGGELIWLLSPEAASRLPRSGS